ncbi:hypothetical protein [Neobacillus drentensis]|uniref:hypothetical protein n=1 Tax=Neobacillus drentensis TaxID=220684 RepID=UPI002FFFC7B7
MSVKDKRKVFKYNEDDILELLSEYLADENGFDTFRSKTILKGTPNKDLRLIAVIGELEDDNISKLDLDDIDKSIEFNGSHKDSY